MRAGFGKLYNSNGLLEYEGNFENSQKHGKGTMVMVESGDVFEGTWERGVRKSGKFIQSDGTIII